MSNKQRAEDLSRELFKLGFLRIYDAKAELGELNVFFEFEELPLNYQRNPWGFLSWLAASLAEARVDVRVEAVWSKKQGCRIAESRCYLRIDAQDFDKAVSTIRSMVAEVRR